MRDSAHGGLYEDGGESDRESPSNPEATGVDVPDMTESEAVCPASFAAATSGVELPEDSLKGPPVLDV